MAQIAAYQALEPQKNRIHGVPGIILPPAAIQARFPWHQTRRRARRNRQARGSRRCPGGGDQRLSRGADEGQAGRESSHVAGCHRQPEPASTHNPSVNRPSAGTPPTPPQGWGGRGRVQRTSPVVGSAIQAAIVTARRSPFRAAVGLRCPCRWPSRERCTRTAQHAVRQSGGRSFGGLRKRAHIPINIHGLLSELNPVQKYGPRKPLIVQAASKLTGYQDIRYVAVIVLALTWPTVNAERPLSCIRTAPVFAAEAHP